MIEFLDILSPILNIYMAEIERQVFEVLHNVNWLLQAHDSYAELIGVKGRKVIIHRTGPCSTCETDCIRTAFEERMPDINLIYYKEKSS